MPLTRMLLAVIACAFLGLSSCGLDDLDYGEFQVTCARERCPAKFCCDADEICVEGGADELGQCSAPQ